uniref:Uncharacterized protein n=1 Tax=Anguilla anguilla TaxID=7936 RepID=A0A0E9RVE6_ANGAN
MSIWHFWPLTS